MDPYTVLSPVQKNPAMSRDRDSLWRALEQAIAATWVDTRARGVARLAAGTGFISSDNVGGIPAEVTELAGMTAAHIALEFLPTY